MPTRILILDTETTSVESGDFSLLRMRLAWTCYLERQAGGRIGKEVWKYWNSPYLLWKYIDGLLRDKSSLTIVGNNIFFDLQCSDFFLYMPRFDWKYGFEYSSGLTYILCLEKNKAKIMILSLTNFWEASVKDLGSMIGMEKIGIDFATTDETELSIYCFRDVEITAGAFLTYLSLIEDNDMGSFGLSRAAQSMNAFRHKHLTVKLLIHHDPDIQSLESAAYHGGRTECFQIGEIKNGPFIDLDINSMYPFIMRNMALPARLIGSFTDFPVDRLSETLRDYCVIAHCKISTDKPAYAVKVKEKILFPIGRFTAFLCTASLRYAIEQGHIDSIMDCAVYEKEIIFSSYVDYFYGMRMQAKIENNKPLERFSKLMLNSLYGKFGQKKPVNILWEECNKEEYRSEYGEDMETGKPIIEKYCFGIHSVYSGEIIHPSSIVSIPAHITDYGRMILWKIIETACKGTVLYCDTDSVKIRSNDIGKIQYPISQSVLGSLKIESTYDRLKIYGCKDYETDKEVKLKGVPKKAKKIGARTFAYEEFLRPASHLHSGEKRYFRIRHIVKTVGAPYDKGIVKKDGSVHPFIFPDPFLFPSMQ